MSPAARAPVLLSIGYMAEWLSIGDAAQPAHPDITSIIQEIVSRNGYTANSAIVLIIEGTGARTAESFEGAWKRRPSCASLSPTRRIALPCEHYQHRRRLQRW